MQKTELWAVESSRIADFFHNQQDVSHTAPGFQYGSCQIILEQLPLRKMGVLSLPQTRITFEGEESDLKKIYRRFFMRFVSAGG